MNTFQKTVSHMKETLHIASY